MRTRGQERVVERPVSGRSQAEVVAIANLNRFLTHGNCDRLGFRKFASWQRFCIRKSFHHYPFSSQTSHVVCQKYEIAALFSVLAVLVSKRTFWLSENDGLSPAWTLFTH